jgi:predicted secreted hydrolase
MTMKLISGNMGEAGALYGLSADVPDQLGGRLQADVKVRDRLGAVNQGYGSASFFPQFLTASQSEEITRSFGNSVRDYLEATGDPMAGQGSYYYSLPLLDVEEFTIARNGAPLSSGSGGTLWMDHVVQTYDQQAVEVLIDGEASWEFFSVMLPEANAAIMAIEITSANGTLPVATLFRGDSDRTRNGALKAANNWEMDKIDIEEVPGTIWVSPLTGQQYVQRHRVRLASQTLPVDLTITMVRENQEIVVGDTIKYEGLAVVEGTLGGEDVEGTAFVELQPVGHL